MIRRSTTQVEGRIRQGETSVSAALWITVSDGKPHLQWGGTIDADGIGLKAGPANLELDEAGAPASAIVIHSMLITKGEFTGQSAADFH